MVDGHANSQLCNSHSLRGQAERKAAHGQGSCVRKYMQFGYTGEGKGARGRNDNAWGNVAYGLHSFQAVFCCSEATIGLDDKRGHNSATYEPQQPTCYTGYALSVLNFASSTSVIVAG